MSQMRRYLDFLPQVLGRVRSLSSLHVQVAGPFPFQDSGIPGIGEGARVSVAEAREVVLVPAERLVDCLGLE